MANFCANVTWKRTLLTSNCIKPHYSIQCRIKLLGALCQMQMGGPVLCHSLVPIPAVSLTASRLKWGLVPIDIMMTSELILTI